jgi:hypothetical protein
MSIVKTDAGRQFALSIQALKRIAQPDDIADVVNSLPPMTPAGLPVRRRLPMVARGSDLWLTAQKYLRAPSRSA